MSRAGLLRMARRQFNRAMRDTCTIRRRTGSTVNDDTSEEVPTWASVYAGPCRIQQQSTAASSMVVGEDEQLHLRIELQLPIEFEAPLYVDDEVTMVTSADDPQLSGQVFIVRDLFAKSDATSRRVGVTRRTS